MTETEVRKLLRKIKEQNSQSAFREFYNLCYDRFFRIAYFYVKNEDHTQQIVLDTFVTLWERRATLLEITSVEDYCFVLIKNRSLDHLEREARRSVIPSDDLPEPDTQTASPEENLINEELFAIYVKALDRLPERCREVFIRVREEKQSYIQVAEELGISTKTVDAQVQKAVKRLKEAIATEL